MRIKILYLLLLLLMVGSVSAAYTITRNSPAQYSIENSTTVIFNITAVDSGGSTNITCGIYNTSNRTGAYSLGASRNLTNNTASNNALNITFADSTRVWWYAGCWDFPNEFSTTLEAQTIPASGSIVNLANDANGVSSVSAIYYNGTANVTLPATNYNVTNGFVYINSSTYEGNSSWWNYSYPLSSNLNQENTTSRVLDVDDYYYEFINIWVPIRLVPQAQGTCDSTSEGTIYYDTTAKTFQGCNSTSWNVLG